MVLFMTYDALFQEISSLPNSMVLQVAEYVRFLRLSMNTANAAESTSSVSSGQLSAQEKLAKRKGGILSDRFISIADDFDATPDCFKEYM